MEVRVIVVCLFVAAIVRGEQAPTSLCRANERLLMCGCPRTCRDPAPDCAAVCRTGCFCENGEVRNDEGICVKLADCPPILSAYKQDTSEPRPNGGMCPDNEEYRYCEPCNKTCDNPNPICPAQCNRGCFCKNGLLRDRDGKCVAPEKCSKVLTALNTTQYEMICKDHQVYKLCETIEKTCSMPNPSVPSPCKAGCFCEKGYVKSPNSQCVKLEECPKGPKAMDSLEIIKNKRSTHKIIEVKTGPATPAQAHIGPANPPQFNGQLLIDSMFQDFQPSHHDPSVEDCAPEEEYFSCGWCEPSCSEPSPTCPNKVCIRGCLCRPPLLRHHTGYCVEAKDCFPEKCNDPNEEYVCLFGCELRCDQRCVRPRYCVLGCYCRIGLLRDNSGLCVAKEKCSNNNVTEIKDSAVDLKKKL